MPPAMLWFPWYLQQNTPAPPATYWQHLQWHPLDTHSTAVPKTIVSSLGTCPIEQTHGSSSLSCACPCEQFFPIPAPPWLTMFFCFGGSWGASSISLLLPWLAYMSYNIGLGNDIWLKVKCRCRFSAKWVGSLCFDCALIFTEVCRLEKSAVSVIGVCNTLLTRRVFDMSCCVKNLGSAHPPTAGGNDIWLKVKCRCRFSAKWVGSLCFDCALIFTEVCRLEKSAVSVIYLASFQEHSTDTIIHVHDIQKNWIKF